MLHDNLSVNPAGHLTVAGFDTVELAARFGTPLYLLDEDRVRSRCRSYVRAMGLAFGGASRPLFASKALSFKGIYRIMAEEKTAIDVVSPGEIFTALKAGFPAADMYFHGNNKTDADIKYALENGVGYFIVDNAEELAVLSGFASGMGIRQKILLRLTPGIDPHTFSAVNTGQLDCQFGVPIETGQARAFVKLALEAPNIELCGFHCHIGSQIFDWTPFRDASDIMLSFISEIKNDLGFEAGVLNLGGGFGVRYVESDPYLDIEDSILRLGKHIDGVCSRLGLKKPTILLEPGRSIVADSGVTLYTAGGVKTVLGFRDYVTVDGGMADDPRFALYGSAYTVVNATRADAPADFKCTVAGRCCETGDRIQENVTIAKPQRGDIIAILSTGAYNYSMASNYNRLCRPPIVLLSSRGAVMAVRRESFEDLTACDL
ncbi:MAG: diaminopimelate decarboxylase [Oscillospiraceae bacterium]|jgi:diaminopimelate decarboxylase|nr:diaminopimelate decarboxylase [Oscillospiraceae bacterium]